MNVYAGNRLGETTSISVGGLWKNATYINKVVIYDENEVPVRTWM
jgi:hypothetical protein